MLFFLNVIPVLSFVLSSMSLIIIGLKNLNNNDKKLYSGILFTIVNFITSIYSYYNNFYFLLIQMYIFQIPILYYFFNKNKNFFYLILILYILLLIFFINNINIELIKNIELLSLIKEKKIEILAIFLAILGNINFYLLRFKNLTYISYILADSIYLYLFICNNINIFYIFQFSIFVIINLINLLKNK